MSRRQMFLTFFILLITLSCQVEEENKSIGGEVSGERAFSASEIIDLKYICAELKIKRQYFETIPDNTIQFTFTGTKKSCTDSIPSNVGNYVAKLRNSSSNNLSFSSTANRYLSDILSDTQGLIALYCARALAGDEFSNTIYLDSSHKMQLIVTIKNGYHYLEVGKFVLDRPNQYSLYHVEGYHIISPINTDQSQYYGMLKERRVVKRCSDKSRTDEFRQILSY